MCALIDMARSPGISLADTEVALPSSANDHDVLQQAAWIARTVGG